MSKTVGVLRRFLTGFLRWLLAVAGFLFRVLALTWVTLAIYYSNLPWAGLRIALAIAFAAFAVWAVWFSRKRRMSMAAALLPASLQSLNETCRRPGGSGGNRTRTKSIAQQA